MKTTLSPFRGGLLGLELNYKNQQAMVRINLGDDWQVTPSDNLLNQLRGISCKPSVTVKY